MSLSVSKQEVHRVCVGARNTIVERGWCQFKGVAPDGRVCLLGAIGLQLHSSGLLSVGSEIASEIARLAVAGAYTPRDLVGWNDALGRTKEDVLALLDKIIEMTAPALELKAVEETSHEYCLTT